MSAILKILRLLYPFLQEFGLKEINLKKFIAENKSISYLFAMCILMFTISVYALDQAHLRLLSNQKLLIEISELKSSAVDQSAMIDQLELMCSESSTEHEQAQTNLSIEESLDKLMGKSNEK